MPKRYFIEIAYNGTNYCGWQVQPNQITVQSVLTDALKTIFNQPIRTIGCGRTDSSVHARQFFVHFDAEGNVPENFLYRINKMLPKDISVYRLIDNVAEDANTRFNATYRAYTYYIHFEKNPFLFKQSFFYPWRPLDIAAMQEAIDLIPQYNDFRMFCKSGGSQKHYLCRIFNVEMIIDEQKMEFHIAANRFLRGMVRRVVGAILMVGKGKISLEEFKYTLETKRPRFATINKAAPPQGLFLTEVRYDFLEDIKR